MQDNTEDFVIAPLSLFSNALDSADDIAATFMELSANMGGAYTLCVTKSNWEGVSAYAISTFEKICYSTSDEAAFVVTGTDDLAHSDLEELCEAKVESVDPGDALRVAVTPMENADERHARVSESRARVFIEKNAIDYVRAGSCVYAC